MTGLLLDTPLDGRSSATTLEPVRELGARRCWPSSTTSSTSPRSRPASSSSSTVDFALRDVVEDVAALLRRARAATRASSSRCRSRRDVPAALVGDPTRLRQVLLNLVGNAIKFTEQGEVGRRASSADAADDGRVGCAFAVRDTGIGIERRDAGTPVRSRSARPTASTTRRYGGTGLGLAISSQLVELMGGRLHGRERAGQGQLLHPVALAASTTLPLAELPSSRP